MDLIFTGISLKAQHTGQPLFHPTQVIPKAGAASQTAFPKKIWHSSLRQRTTIWTSNKEKSLGKKRLGKVTHDTKGTLKALE